MGNIKKQATYNGTKDRKARTKKKSTKISYISKPERMSVRDWQVKLRQQAAESEKLAISCVDDKLCPGEYEVTNPQTANTYKVVYRGAKSEWNYCSCMDFKTSRLGTCKHVEAVKKWLCTKSRLRVHQQIPAYTSVYLSYCNERCVKIRIGTDNHEAYSALAKKYFDSQNTLKPASFGRFGSFIQEAMQINDTFRCYADALRFVVEKREKTNRKMLLEKYDDAALDSLLKVKLYPYQKEGIRFATRAGKAIIADEMGLGKTIQAIGTAELLRKEGLIVSTLIICPTSLKYQWRSEIMKFTDAEVCVVEGNHLKRKEAYQSPEPYKIVSYNSACNDIKILGSLQTDMLIMDEVQRLKNWNTQISRAARKIQSDYSVILSGTPLENKLDELYSIVEFVDNFRLSPYYMFKQNHIISDETGQVLGYKNLNEIGKKLSDILIRRRKKDVKLQMPKRTDKNLFIPMTKEQREMHDEWQESVNRIVIKWRTHHFISETDRERLLLFLSEMRMICDSSYILDQKTRYDTKVKECVNIICNITSEEGEKVVVFSQWERMTRLIARELEEKGIRYEYLHGGIPSEKRKDLVDNFNNLPESRVFLSTDAGSTGLNLQAAATIINIDLPWNPAVLEQRIGRIYRLGQQNNIQVINLVAPESIEDRMLDKLRFKTSMFEGVLDNGEDSVFISKNRFEQIMETVAEIVEDEPDSTKAATESTAGTAAKATDEAADGNTDKNETKDSAESTASADKQAGAKDQYASQSSLAAPAQKTNKEKAVIDGNDTEEEVHTSPEQQAQSFDGLQELPFDNTQTNPQGVAQANTQGGMSTTSPNEEGNTATFQPATQPQALVAQGISFLTGLAETLKSPEATAKLVDSIVERDEKTGQTSIKIPVESKETVSNLFGLLGKLFSGK